MVDQISVTARVPSVRYPLAEYDEIQAINARGLLVCMQAELEAMLRQEPTVTTDGHSPVRAQRGSIINIASTCGSLVIPEMLPYVTSKHAVVGITKAAAVDHAAQKVRINAVCPGLVETPMIAKRRQQTQNQPAQSDSASLERFIPANIYNTPSGRLAESDEVADACIFLASTMASNITGTSLTIDGGRSAVY
jgi:NAD(P)-dependent dehydrogenase (short-subunit alcohol dehydrogenase family)